MLRLSVSFAARQDLEDILYYSIANFGETTASQYRADLDAAIVSIGGDPRIGRPIKNAQALLQKANLPKPWHLLHELTQTG